MSVCACVYAMQKLPVRGCVCTGVCITVRGVGQSGSDDPKENHTLVACSISRAETIEVHFTLGMLRNPGPCGAPPSQGWIPQVGGGFFELTPTSKNNFRSFLFFPCEAQFCVQCCLVSLFQTGVLPEV